MLVPSCSGSSVCLMSISQFRMAGDEFANKSLSSPGPLLVPHSCHSLPLSSSAPGWRRLSHWESVTFGYVLSQIIVSLDISSNCTVSPCLVGQNSDGISFFLLILHGWSRLPIYWGRKWNSIGTPQQRPVRCHPALCVPLGNYTSIIW